MNYLTQSVAALVLGLSANASFAQNCISGATPITPTSRFSLEEDLVVDKHTGLTWQRCVVGQSWNAATQNCDGLPLAKNWKSAMQDAPEGWRVPNIRELNSITEFTCVRPTINLTVFPNAPTDFFWSSTPMVNVTDPAQAGMSAWGMFYLNGIPGGLKKDSAIYVRLVRSPAE